ncbi:MAG: YhgE/Pip family protein [Microterricola sp.]
MARTFSATGGSERLGRLAVLGVLAVPLLIGGILAWALAAPTQNLDRVTAAIVNNDEPVMVDGNTVPLGRQFAAGLIEGPSDPAESTSNFTWVLTNSDEAALGLGTGRYAAVVTIPESFSAAATSMGGQASDAREAVFEVATSPASAALDPTITQLITEAAAAAVNQQLIEQYLDNVYAGFNTINEQIGQASDGAASLVSGADSVSSGAQSLADGASQLTAGLDSLDAGADSLASGLAQLDAASQPLPGQTAQLAAGAAGVAAAVGSLAAAVSDATTQFAAVTAQICVTPGLVCDRATAALARLQNADQQTAALATGAGQVASGNAQLADAMPSLVAGIDASAGGGSEVAAGSAQAASGAESLSAGAQSLAAGAAQLDDGAAQLSDGLSQAVTQIPTYSDSDISTLSTVVSQPVLADQDAVPAGVQTVPLFAVVALWLGGLVIAIARRAVPTRLLLTSVPSRTITLRSLGPTAALGAGQGAVVAVAVLTAVNTSPLAWMSFAGASVLIGAVFAIANQGLAAALGSVGRLVAVLVAVLALAAGLSGSVPPAIASTAGAIPTAPALSWLLACLTGDGPAALAAVALLALATVFGIALVYAGVARHRTYPRHRGA